MNKSVKSIFLTFVIFVLLLTACSGQNGGSEGTSDASASLPVDGDTILIGEVDPLTGPAAVYGAPQKDVIEMAIDEINEAGGVTVDGKQYNFELIAYDDKGDANEAIAAARKLIDRDGVKYLLGWASSGSTVGAAEMLGQEDVLMLVGTAGEQSIVTQGYENIFRTRPPGGYTGGPAGQFIADQGVKELAVLGQLKDTIYQQYYEQFKETFIEAGGTIVEEETFNLGDRDMYTQLTKIVNREPEAIFVPGYVEQGAFVFRQLRELSFEGDIYAFVGGTPEQFTEILASEQMEGIYDLRPLETTYDAMSETGQQYVENYFRRYNKNPVPSAVHAYDQVYVLKHALEKANSFEVEKLIEAIRELEPPEEAALTYIPINGKMFDENGQAFTTNVAMRWEDGDWRFLQELPGDAEAFSEHLTQLRKETAQ